MISIPVHTCQQELPFDELSWLNFEKLCLSLVRLDQTIEHTQSYGTQGDEQGGIDIYARHRGSDFYSTYQCKNVVDFGPAKIEDAVDVFLKGEWVAKSATFVLCTRESLASKVRADAIEAQAKRLKRRNTEFVIWDEAHLSALLKSHPAMVDDFFGRPWVVAFCGPDAAAKLGDHLTIDQREAALTVYSELLDKTLGRVIYRGFAGRLESARSVELPLNGVYVEPYLNEEARQELDEKRERELLALLEDLDGDESRHAEWERELNALKARAWNPSLQLPKSWNWNDKLLFVRDRPSLQELKQSLKAQRRCAILGAPGSGKSTLLRWLALQCVRSHLHPDRVSTLAEITEDVPLFPVLIPLATFASQLVFNATLSLQQFLERYLAALGIPQLETLFEREWENGRCWVLLDGLNEIKDARLRGRVVEQVELFLACCGQNRCLLTSRIYGAERVSGLPRFHLGSFDPEQIGVFVRHWHWTLELELRPDSYDLDAASERAADLIGQLNSNPDLRALAANPLLLVAMLLLHEQNLELPTNRVEIYHATTQTLLETWNRWRGAALYDAGGQTLSPIQLRRVLGKIALWSRRDKPRGIMRRAELTRRICTALEELGFEGDAKLTAQSYLDAAVGEAGLLEERSPGFFAFWHPTFEEFLAATELAETPVQSTTALVSLRGDSNWRDITLLTVGVLSQINDDAEGATDLVRALAKTELDSTEPLFHNVLRLGVACLAQAPGLSRSLVQELVLELVEALARQPFDPMAEAFAEIVQALPRFKPGAELVSALKPIIELPLSEAPILSGALRWLANVAESDERAFEICRQVSQWEVEADVPREIALARFYAIIGLARAGEIDGGNLTLLVWHKRTIEFIGEIAELLGIAENSTELTAAQKSARLEQIHSIMNTPISVIPCAKRLTPREAGVILKPLAGALILLFAGDRSPDIDRVLEEALLPKYDLCGGVFDAAHACQMFDFSQDRDRDPNRERNIKLQRLGLRAQRRWLRHPQPYRRFHAAQLVFELVEEWEKRMGSFIERDPANEGKIEEVKAESFREAFRYDRHVLRKDALACLKGCLSKLDFWFQLEAGQTLLRYGQIADVVEAIEKWAKASTTEFPKFSMGPLVSRIEETREGHEVVVSWMRGEDDWLKILAVTVLKPNSEFRVETQERLAECLSSPHDEIRSVAGTTLAFFDAQAINSEPQLQLDPRIESALRSCLVSEISDASPNAAATLYRLGARDDEVLTGLAPYFLAPEMEGRLDTIRAFQEASDELLIEAFAEDSDLFSPEVTAACHSAQRGRISPEETKLLVELVEFRAEDTHDGLGFRRFCFDWLWLNLQKS